MLPAAAGVTETVPDDLPADGRPIERRARPSGPPTALRWVHAAVPSRVVGEPERRVAVSQLGAAIFIENEQKLSGKHR